jgi:hypothetical protein
MSGTSKRHSKSFLVTLVAAAILLQLCVAGPAAATSVTLSWSYNYTVDVPCTLSLTKNCVSGFEYGTTPDGGTSLNKIGTLTNPTPAGSGSTAVTATFTQGHLMSRSSTTRGQLGSMETATRCTRPWRWRRRFRSCRRHQPVSR